MNYSPDALAALDLKNGIPQASVPEFVEIQMAESGGNPIVVDWDSNGGSVGDTTGALPGVPFQSYDTGLAQINSSHDPNYQQGIADTNWIKQMQNPKQNIKEALAISAGGTNFSAWNDDGVPGRGSWPTGQQALNDVLSGKVGAVAGNPTGSTAGQSGTSTSAAPTNTSNQTEPSGGITLTGPAAVLQTLSDLMNPGGIKGGIGGLLSGSTEASIATNVEAFAIRLFMAAGFLALAYIGVKTMTTGSGSSGPGIIVQAQQKANRREGIDLANRNLSSGEANRQSRESIASADREAAAREARLQRAAATRAQNRAYAAGQSYNP